MTKDAAHGVQGGMRPRRVVLDVAAFVALTALALVPLFAAYGSADFWIAAAGGIALGTAVAVAGALMRWRLLTVAAVAVVVYFVFGAALALREQAIFGILPSLDALATLAIEVVHVWKQALTLTAPLDGFDELLVAPYAAGLVAAVVGVSLALRLRRRFGWALVAPAGLLVLSIAFSTYDGLAPAAVGALSAGIALAWTVWRLRQARADRELFLPADDAPRHRAGAATASAAVVLVAAVALGGAAATTAAGGDDRTVLRDSVVPPLDVRDYASPLTGFHRYSVTEQKTTLITVSGLPEGVPLRLAAMDVYDGIVYKVSSSEGAGAGGAGAGRFTRVGRELRTDAVGETAHVTVEVGGLSGVWVPTAGRLTGIRFEGADARVDGEALHYNAATGTAVVTTGLAKGDEYDFDAVVAPDPGTPEARDAALAGDTVSSITTAPPSGVPDDVATVLGDAIASTTDPIDQLAAIEKHLSTDGHFSDGSENATAPSRASHNEDRIAQLLEDTRAMVGDDEQYAVAMALMVSELHIPVRVVMGFTPQSDRGTVAVKGSDVHAWVEVPFVKSGWVRYDPTPPDTQVLTDIPKEQRTKPRPQVLQPPQVPEEPAELPPSPPRETAADGPQVADLTWLWTGLRVGGSALAALAVLFGPSIAFAIARSRRRRRRADRADSVGRVDGGWAEVLDRALDVGTPLAAGATRRESADVLADRYPDAGVAQLARRADVAVFGATDPTPEEATAYWADVATATKRIGASVPWHRRLRAALFPASLFLRREPRNRSASRTRRGRKGADRD